MIVYEEIFLNRSFKLDLIPPSEQRFQIVASIRKYRTVCRQVYSAVAMAKMASADIQDNGDEIRITPQPNSEIELLTSTFGRNPQRTINKNDLHPTALAFVWDSMRRDVASRWKSKDAEFPKATRGWLTLNGVRGFARFNRIGIGCPVLTARPEFREHSLFIKWDHEIGPVEFKIPRLDGGRYSIYQNIRDNTPGWKLGTLYLNERDGRVFATVSYSRPDKKDKLDPTKNLTVTFSDNPEKFITVAGPGRYDRDELSAVEAASWLDELNAVRRRYETRRAAVGNPNKPWGSRTSWRAVQSRLSKNTGRRENGVKTRNHLWTRRIVDRASAWSCGKIVVSNVPETLFERPWKWSQFVQFLEYKIAECGGICVVDGK